jgi:hypothetical protein
MKFTYTLRGFTQTHKTKEEVEEELRQALEDATDDGPFEIQEVEVEQA